jgi:hypothetical protein
MLSFSLHSSSPVRLLVLFVMIAIFSSFRQSFNNQMVMAEITAKIVSCPA